MTSSILKTLIALAAPVVLVACETATGKQPLVGSAYRIELETIDNSHALQQGGIKNLHAFLTSQQAGMQDDILFSWNRDDQMASKLMTDAGVNLRGLGFVDLFEHPSPIATGKGEVIVTLRRYRASVPGCENPNPVNGYANGPFYGFGCANLTNLTQMIADPRDLKRSRDLTPAQTGALLVGYQRILVDEPKELEGGITEIGGGDE